MGTKLALIGTGIVILAGFLFTVMFLQVFGAVDMDVVLYVTFGMLAPGGLLQMVGLYLMWCEMRNLNRRFNEQLGRTRATLRRP